MKKATRILALVLCAVMCLGLFVGCGNKGKQNNDTPLVVGYSPFNSKFSPFFSETAYDQDVWTMTAISLLNGDRQGAIIMKGIEGETKAYNGTDYTYYGPADCEIKENTDGTVDYNFKLREDLKSPSTTSSSPCTSCAILPTTATAPCLLCPSRAWMLTVPVWTPCTT